MGRKATVTVSRTSEELQRLWQSSDYRPGYIDGADAAVSFADAPGGRGTEVHVDFEGSAPGGKLGEVVKKLLGSDPRAKAMDDLRRFKQHVETGVIARSEGTPEGELAERKLKPRPAQPLDASQIDKAGV